MSLSVPRHSAAEALRKSGWRLGLRRGNLVLAIAGFMLTSSPVLAATQTSRVSAAPSKDAGETPDGFRHEMIPVGDVTVHAVVGGKGPPLVLIHGFPETWYAWRHVMPRLAETHTIVAVDLPGAGHSDKPLDGYDKVSLAADVHGVMRALGYDQYAVAGHDIGAMVALALAETHREAVTHLVVMDTPQPGWSKWDSEFSDPRLWHFAFQMKRDLPERLIYGREYDYVSTFLYDRAYNMGGLPEEDVQVFSRAFAEPGNTRGALEWYRAFTADDKTATAWKSSPLTIPVLAIGGEHRFGPQIVGMMHEFATDVSGGSVPGAGHWLAEENPAYVSEAIITFLNRKGAARR